MLGVSAARTAIEDRLRMLRDAKRGAPALGDQDGAPMRPDESRRGALRMRAVALRAAGLWLATRVALALFTYYAVTYSHSHALVPAPYDNPIAPTSLGQYLAAWRQWDTKWYLTIVAGGYSTMPTAAFFPLYPLLVRVLSFVIGPPSDALVAALVASNLAALAAFVGLGLFAAQEAGTATATRSIRLLAAYPLAFFLASGYSDGLFLALAVFALFFARRGAWWWAAACALLAGLTRLTAVILILPLLWEYARQHALWDPPARWHALRALRRNPCGLCELAAVAAAVPAGISLFVAYLWHTFGHPKIMLYAESTVWHHAAMLPWTSLWLALRGFFAAPSGSELQAHISFDLGLVLICSVLTLVMMLQRAPVAFSLYMVGLVLLCMMSPIPTGPDIYVSAGRYLLASAPLYLMLGRWARRPWLDTLLLCGGFLVQGALAAQFLTGAWII